MGNTESMDVFTGKKTHKKGKSRRKLYETGFIWQQ